MNVDTLVPARLLRGVGRFITAGVLGSAALVCTNPVVPAAAQTIDGTLMDLDTGQPIPSGLVLMFTEAGDSVAMTVTDEQGRFTVTSPEPGSFLLLASALGYEETAAGVFELGADGVMSVEYRIEPEPLPIDEIVVSIERPVLRHRLVRNGFVRRLQRGLGAFVTPHDIEESPASSTEQLLEHIPGVRVAEARVLRSTTVAGESVVASLPRPDVGETVQIRGPGGAYCTPTVYVDGIRSAYSTDPTSPSVAFTLSSLAPLAVVEAVEVYRRPAEVPVEYSPRGSGANSCGVLVVWTGSAPSSGRRAADVAGGPGAVADLDRPLPPVDERGPAPVPGERIRAQLDTEVTERLRLDSPWEGTFLSVRDGNLVANDPSLGRAVVVPSSGVEALQVQRQRDRIHAFKRGVFAGTAFAVGMWKFLDVLCGDRCGGGTESAWFPASIAGVVFGVLVGARGPGTHWVDAPLPEGPPLPDPPSRTEAWRDPPAERPPIPPGG